MLVSDQRACDKPYIKQYMNGVILGREMVAFKSYPYDFSDLDFLL